MPQRQPGQPCHAYLHVSSCMARGLTARTTPLLVEVHRHYEYLRKDLDDTSSTSSSCFLSPQVIKVRLCPDVMPTDPAATSPPVRTADQHS